MINAKNKFKEGYIMLLRPFDFANLDRPLQQFTILYAYAEQPKFSYKIDPRVNEEFKDIKYRVRFRLGDDKEEYLSERYEELLRKYPDKKTYEGEVVQSIVDGELCKFFPDEYSIIDKQKFSEVIYDDIAYKLDIQDETIYHHVKDQIYYAQTRGISKDMATRIASFNVHDAVILRPTIHLLDEFLHQNRIFCGKSSTFRYRNREWLHFHYRRPVYYDTGFGGIKFGRIEFDNNKYWLPFCGYVNAETVKIYEV